MFIQNQKSLTVFVNNVFSVQIIPQQAIRLSKKYGIYITREFLLLFSGLLHCLVPGQIGKSSEINLKHSCHLPLSFLFNLYTEWEHCCFIETSHLLPRRHPSLSHNCWEASGILMQLWIDKHIMMTILTKQARVYTLSVGIQLSGLSSQQEISK